MKKRIVFIDEGRGIGGAEKNLIALLEHLDKERFKPIVILSCKDKFYTILNNLEIKTAIVKTLPFLSISMEFGGKRVLNPFAVVYDLLLILVKSVKLYFYLSDKDVSTIQTNGMLEHIYGGIAAKWGGTPCIWYMQDIPSSTLLFQLKKLILNKLAAVLATKVVVVSRAVNGVFNKQAKDKTSVIYVGIDLPKYKAKTTEEINQIKSKWNIRNAECVIGMVGRLVRWKGHIDFIKAAKIISAEIPNTKFIIVGGTIFGKEMYLKHLENLCQRLGIKDKVIFTGFIDDVIEPLSIIDLFIQCSIHPDPCPLTVLEAGALKKVIVATDIGGIPEIIENGRDGILVEPNNPQALANEIINLIKFPQRQRLLGEMIYKKIIRKFDIKEEVHNFERIYG